LRTWGVKRIVVFIGRHLKGAGHHAIAAADAFVGVIGHRAVGCLVRAPTMQAETQEGRLQCMHWNFTKVGRCRQTRVPMFLG
jgi:hypothetical protein